jgi:hypothetical protein
MSDRDKINSRPRRASEAHRKSRQIERKANMEAFEREHQEYKEKMQAENDEIRKNRKQDERARVAYKERDNTDRERTDSENELRRNNDRRNQSSPSRRSSIDLRSSRSSLKKKLK